MSLAAPRARWRDPLVISANALGITQITAWGTSYYCLGVLAKPIVAETALGDQLRLPGFQPGACDHGTDLGLGRPADRSRRRAVR